MQNGITFVIRTLRGGGAERVLSNLANNYAARGRNVTVITTIPTLDRDQDAYALHPTIRRVMIPKWLIEFSWWKNDYLPNPFGVKRLRNEIIRADNNLVVAFMEKAIVPVALAIKGLECKLIGSLRCHPVEINPGCVKKWFWRKLYPTLHRITVLDQTWIDDWGAAFIPRGKMVVIPNYVIAPDVNATPSPEVALPQRFICAVGRLDAQKGFDILLAVFSRLAVDYPDLHLVILGEGPLEGTLKTLTKALGLESRVHFPGFIRNPHKLMKQGEMFVLSSRHEGMPNILLEAMAIGMPVVSFDCPTGPARMIVDNENGLLVERENEQKMEEAVRYMLDNPSERQRMGDHARTVINDFSWEKISNLWARMLG